MTWCTCEVEFQRFLACVQLFRHLSIQRQHLAEQEQPFFLSAIDAPLNAETPTLHQKHASSIMYNNAVKCHENSQENETAKLLCKKSTCSKYYLREYVNLFYSSRAHTWHFSSFSYRTLYYKTKDNTSSNTTKKHLNVKIVSVKHSVWLESNGMDKWYNIQTIELSLNAAIDKIVKYLRFVCQNNNQKLMTSEINGK